MQGVDDACCGTDPVEEPVVEQTRAVDDVCCGTGELCKARRHDCRASAAQARAAPRLARCHHVAARRRPPAGRRDQRPRPGLRQAGRSARRHSRPQRRAQHRPIVSASSRRVRTSCSGCCPSAPACSMTPPRTARAGRAEPARPRPAGARPRGRVALARRGRWRRCGTDPPKIRLVAVRGAGRVGAARPPDLRPARCRWRRVPWSSTNSSIAAASDVTPAGPSNADVGASRADAAIRAARRLAPGLRSTLPRGRGPDVVVLSLERSGPGDLPDPALGARGDPPSLLRRYETSRESSDRWCCPAALPAGAATTCTVPTATPPGRASPHS